MTKNALKKPKTTAWCCASAETFNFYPLWQPAFKSCRSSLLLAGLCKKLVWKSWSQMQRKGTILSWSILVLWVKCLKAVTAHSASLDMGTKRTELSAVHQAVKMWVQWSICYLLLLSLWQLLTSKLRAWCVSPFQRTDISPFLLVQFQAHFETRLQLGSWWIWGFESKNTNTEHSQNKENKTANAAKGLCNSRECFMCLSESRQTKHCPHYQPPLHPSWKTTRNRMEPKELRTKNNTGGVVGCTGKWWTLEKRVVWEEQNGEKDFKPRKALFRPKQVHLATFLAVLKLKAEKQQQESMQGKGQSSSFIVPREAEDMIRNQPQALFRPIAPTLLIYLEQHHHLQK